MFEWSFQRKLATGVILLCALAVVTSVVSLFTTRALISSTTKVTTGEGQDLADVRALQLIGLKSIADVHACLLTGGTEFAPGARAGSARARDLVQRLQARTTDVDGRALLDSVMAAARAHEHAFQRALALPGDRVGVSTALFSQRVLPQSGQYERALAALVTHCESARVRNLAPVRAEVDRAEKLLLVFSGMMVLLMVMLMVLLCVVLRVVLNRSYGERSTARRLAETGQIQAGESVSEVEAVSRLKVEFLAAVSHELRNPLAPILTWTQLLRSGTLDREKTAHALEVIERNVISQTQLIDDLVDVSKVVSGTFRLEVRPVELVPVIKAAAETHAPASDAKEIEVQLALDERAGTISGDPEQLQQVMSNLISNAIKFTPPGGKVRVVLRPTGSHVLIVVSDNGIGIDAEFLSHVFKPFRQGTGGTMRRQSGLGLGLSIVRRIVELHGGEIKAFSEGPDRGSEFTVKFPLLPATREGDAHGATARVASPTPAL